MKKEEKIYDKNDPLLKQGDVKGCTTLEPHYDPHPKDAIWRIEEFGLSYKE